MATNCPTITPIRNRETENQKKNNQFATQMIFIIINKKATNRTPRTHTLTRHLYSKFTIYIHLNQNTSSSAFALCRYRALNQFLLDHMHTVGGVRQTFVLRLVNCARVFVLRMHTYEWRAWMYWFSWISFAAIRSEIQFTPCFSKFSRYKPTFSTRKHTKIVWFWFGRFGYLMNLFFIWKWFSRAKKCMETDNGSPKTTTTCTQARTPKSLRLIGYCVERANMARWWIRRKSIRKERNDLWSVMPNAFGGADESFCQLPSNSMRFPVLSQSITFFVYTISFVTPVFQTHSPLIHFRFNWTISFYLNTHSEKVIRFCLYASLTAMHCTRWVYALNFVYLRLSEIFFLANEVGAVH